jgi:hypothetical protein
VTARTFTRPRSRLRAGTIANASSHDYWDTILLLLDPDGLPVLGSDDSWKYFAAFDWVAPASGTYEMRVTFFEGVITGGLRVSRK